ncbi:MAG: flippase-like domain-containing protein [Endomicrobiales bacterium]|nr:flippase-like domain-containing protein [Endomicrobiales bacterium]
MIKSIVTLLITLAIFTVIVLNVELSKTLQVFSRVNLQVVLLMVFVSLTANLIIAPLQTKYVLKTLNADFSFYDSFLYRIGCLPAKKILPFNLGEVARIVYLKRAHDIGIFKGTAVVLLQYFHTILALFLFVVYGAVSQALEPLQWRWIFLSVVFTLVIVPVLMAIKQKRVMLGFLPEKARQKLFGNGCEYGLNGYGIASAIMISILLQMLLLMNYFLAFAAAGIYVPASVMVKAGVMTMIVSAIPVTIGGAGSREAAILLLFSKYATIENLLVSGFLVTLTNTAVPIIAGLVVMRGYLKRFIYPDSENVSATNQ